MLRLYPGINRSHFSIILVLLIALGSCAVSPSSGRHSSSSADGLDDWVDGELAPYLADELGRQPRFRNEPVLLVAMRDADIQPDIDSLTRSLRDRLLDQLLQTPGTNIVRRPNAYAHEHHRSLLKPECQTASNARYFISIDIVALSANEVRVNVRGLELGTGNWVSGFGKTWQGRLTRAQQHAFRQRRTDEYLRGLRPLPFGQDNSDLAAVYLAQNIACVLRGEQALQAAVTLDPGLAENSALNRILTLVSHNLSKQRGKPGAGNAVLVPLVLNGTLTTINNDLHQLWVSVQETGKKTKRNLVDTSVYLSGIPTGDTEAPQEMIAQAASKSVPPALTSKPVHQRQDGILLSPLRVVSMMSPEECSGFDRHHCQAIEFDLLQPAYVLLLRQSPGSGLVWMPATGCEWSTEFPNRLNARENVRASALSVTGDAENIYAIAVTSKQLATELQQHLAGLPSACFGKGIASGDTEHDLQWLAELDLLLEQERSRVDWQAINLVSSTD